MIDPLVPPSGTGCVECEQEAFWWVHLRRCAKCGHIGCCDDSIRKHATAHALSSGHTIIRSFEPGEDWFWDYAASEYVAGPPLTPPGSHPEGQSVPGPADRVPADWSQQLSARPQ